MKLNRLLFASFLAFSLILSACGDNDVTPTVTDDLFTEVPGTTNTPDDMFTEEPNGTPTDTLWPTDQPTAVDTLWPTDQPTPEDTRWPTETAEITPTVDTGTPGGTIEPTTDPMTDTAGLVNPWRVSNLLDFDVWNNNGEQIGAVEDLVIDMHANGEGYRAHYAIIEVGGFLGIGGKLVAVPYEILRPGTEESGIIDDPERAFFLDVSRETVETAPEFDRDVFPELGEPTDAGYDAGWDTYWYAQTGIEPQETMAPQVTQTADGTTPDPMLGTRIEGAVLATQLLDLDVQTDYDTEFGDVQDVIVNPDSGEVLYLIVEISDMGDLDGQWMLVPLHVFVVDADAGRLVVIGTEEDLIGAPTYEANQLPDTANPDWDTDVRNYWWNDNGTE
ncbi:MAG: PRC-barrel domain-containing protein [Chloroflexota bacterium]